MCFVYEYSNAEEPLEDTSCTNKQIKKERKKESIVLFRKRNFCSRGKRRVFDGRKASIEQKHLCVSVQILTSVSCFHPFQQMFIFVEKVIISSEEERIT